MDMALRREIIDLIGLCLLHKADEVRRVGHVPIMEKELHIRLMHILEQVLDACRVEG